jgi:hypothetical protein
MSPCNTARKIAGIYQGISQEYIKEYCRNISRNIAGMYQGILQEYIKEYCRNAARRVLRQGGPGGSPPMGPIPPGPTSLASPGVQRDYCAHTYICIYICICIYIYMYIETNEPPGPGVQQASLVEPQGLWGEGYRPDGGCEGCIVSADKASAGVGFVESVR